MTEMRWYYDPAALLGELRRAEAKESRPQIAGYDDLVEIGRGGQGIVFAATQTSTGRRVAVKVLAGGAFAGRDRQRRFDREVRLAAALAHECVVRIHDSGTTTQGWPFLVMELVEGVPLDGWWNSLPSEPRARQRAIATLFAELTGALAHAHGRGVIHRDLKPSNVRVDARGRPRILDFGLAKSEHDDLHSLSVTGEFLGSLPWASPEQVSGDANQISTATDIYQVGVLLYQALCGCFPYDVTGGFRDVIERITAADPVRPTSVDRSLDSELSSIVLRCLVKQPQDRYATALDLNRDLERWLRGEPIAWRADSTWSTLRKQLRRHRVAVRVALGFLVLSVVASVIMAGLWFRAVGAERTARAELAQSLAMFDFLRGLLEQADPSAGGQHTRVLDVVLRASDDLDTVPALSRQARSMLHAVLGMSFLNLDAIDRAEVHLPRGVAGLVEEAGAAHPWTLNARSVLARLHLIRGRGEEALALARQCLADARNALGAHPLTSQLESRLGWMLLESGRLHEAEACLRAGLAGQQAAGDDRASLGVTLNNLALTLSRRGDRAGARELYTTTLAELATAPQSEQVRAGLLNNFASFLHSAGELAEARASYEQALELDRSVLGEDHYATLSVKGNLAKLLLDQRAFDGAEPLQREVYEGSVRRQGKQHPATLLAAHNLGTTLMERGDLTAANALLSETAELRSRVLGSEHGDTLTTKTSLATLLWRLGEREPGIRIDREVLAVKRRTLGDEKIETVISMNNVAKKLEELDQLAEAAALYDLAIAGGSKALPEGHYYVALFRSNQGVCLRRMQRFDQAEQTLQAAVGALEATFGPADGRTRQAMRNLVAVYDAWDKPQEAQLWRTRLSESGDKR